MYQSVFKMATPWEEHRSFVKAYSPKDGATGKYIKVDFHFHTIASGSDYKEKSCTYDDIANAINAAHFDAVFVTDHNAWEGIKLLREACKRVGCKTKILPGVELTLQEKAICLLDDGKKIDNVKFHCLALLPDDSMAESRIESLVTNNHTDTNVLTNQPVERIVKMTVAEVSRKLKEWGGLLIPAHLHQGGGLKSRSIDDLYSDSITIELFEAHFDAVEIRKPTNDIFHGRYVTPKGLKVPKMAAVLGSDAHELSRIGSEATFILAEEVSFEEIKASLMHRSRIQFTERQAANSRIVSMTVNGAFIKDFGIAFSPYMNSLIGAKGSGKTSIVELLRFGLGYSPATDLRKYITHLLGPTGKVSIEIQTVTGETFLFQRRHDDPKPTVLTSDGSPVDRDAVIPKFFNIEIRGWGETTSLAVSEVEQLNLIDNLDKSGIIAKADTKLEKLQAGLPGKYAEIVSLKAEYQKLKVSVDLLTIKEKSLEKLKADSLTILQTKKEEIDREKAVLGRIRENVRVSKSNLAIKLLSDEITTQFSELDKLNASNDRESKEVITKLIGTRNDVGDFESKANTDAMEKLNELDKALEVSVKQISDSNARFDQEYQEEFNKLSLDEQSILVERNEVTIEIANLNGDRVRLKTLWERLAKGIADYAANLKEMQDNVGLISVTRKGIVDEINRLLQSSNVDTKISLEENGFVSGSLPPGKTPKNVFAEIGADFAALDEMSVLINPVVLSSLQQAQPEFSLVVRDKPVISFKLYGRDWKNTNELSAGQKSTAVLPLLLYASEGPIVMDQPEDNLDNKYIGSSVVNMLTQKKASSQIIVTSHNASIVVMSDSEFILEMEDQNNCGKIKCCGFLSGPHSKIKDSVLNILDGGEEALRSRFKKYGLK